MAKLLFSRFLMQEGIRQDRLIHDTSSYLGTKNGLFMVFTAFMFTAESALVNSGGALGLYLPRWPLVISLIFSLAGIAVLLWSARLVSYRMPPILPALRTQSEKFFDLPAIKHLPEEEQMWRLEDKFVNSLTRSIEENFEANKKISQGLTIASWMVGVSLSCLVLSLLWTAGSHAFACRHALGFF